MLTKITKQSTATQLVHGFIFRVRASLANARFNVHGFKFRVRASLTPTTSPSIPPECFLPSWPVRVVWLGIAQLFVLAFWPDAKRETAHKQ